MASWASLIIWLPLLGFLFNAFAGKLLGTVPQQAAGVTHTAEHGDIPPGLPNKAARRWVSIVAPGVVLASFLFALAVVLPAVMSQPDHRMIVPLIPGTDAATPWINFFNFRINFALLLDPLSLLMTLIITGVGGLIHIYATGYMAEDPEQPRFFTYFNLFIFMMLVLVLGENFLLMFVGWEGVGSCSYLLISFWYTDSNNAKAGNKAFIVNRVGDLGFALGMMAVWSVFGTLSFFTTDHKGVMDMAQAGMLNGHHHAIDILHNPVSTAMLTLMCCLLFVGAMGKSAQIPLWVWLPDAMAGPTPVSALIHAATMVTAGVVMLTRCSWLFVQAPGALQLVGWIGLATAFMGATIGLVQNDIKRVLAYSTVSQLGYMFLACGVGNFTAGMFHVTTHAFFKALLFLGSGAVIHSMLGEQDMRKMGGLKPKIFRTWLVMIIGTYAIAGFPGLSGFWSKDAILDSALRSPWGSEYYANWILYIVGLATAFMTAFYMNRLMWKTFYTDPRFVDGQLDAHHHSNFDDEPYGAHGPDMGHEEETTGSAAHSAQEHDAGHGHGTGSVHESPPSMMIPLYILAFLAVGFGWFAGPFGPSGGNLFRNFLQPSVADMTLGGLEEGKEVFSAFAGYAISSVVAIAGLVFAFVLYGRHKQTGDLVPAERKVQWEQKPLNLYTFLLNKWWWDWLYNTIFIRFGGFFADKIVWRTWDAQIIDGSVNGAGKAVQGLSGLGRRLQSGYVRNYALAMLVGVVILLVGLLLKWTDLLVR